MNHRVVLAGCGGISRAWLGAVDRFDDLEVAGMVDLVPENIKGKIEDFGLSPMYTGDDLAEAIAKTGADLVFDCTIPEAHVSVVTAGLEAGCNVMGEKPMADTMENAREMVATAHRTGLTYAVMQNRRYNENIRKYRDTLRSAPIGSLTTLNADFYLGAHFGGFRDEMDHVLLLDMAIHSFDEARFISGSDPLSVFCHEWNPKGSWYADGASAVCVFEMTGGVVFTYRGSWCAEGLNTSWECNWRGVGETGSVTWDGYETVAGEHTTGEDGFHRSLGPIETASVEEFALPTGHVSAIRDYLDAIDARKDPPTVCSDNIKSVSMVHAAIESAETGRKVEMHE